MRLLLTLLRLGFWALPAQRLCTVAGLGLLALASLWLVPAGHWEWALPWTALGSLLAVLPALVLGGPLWRAFAAQRGVALAPHGRARLLLAVFLVALLVGLVLATHTWSLYARQPPPWRMDLPFWWKKATDNFALASWWAVASFLAARSLLATFTVLVVVVGTVLAVVQLELPPPEQWLPGGNLSTTLLLWAVCAAWFLRARRIRPSAWTSRRAEDEALVTRADTGGITGRLSRATAMRRLLLGGRDLWRIVLQWLLALGLLQAMLVAIQAATDVPPGQVRPLHFAALLLAIPAMGALSWLVAGRLRPLWLASGCSRAGLFGVGEKTLLSLAAGLGIVCAAAFLVLWQLLPVRSGASAAFGLCALLGPMLLPVHAALLHGSSGAVTLATMAAVMLPAWFAVRAYLGMFVAGGGWGDQWWLLAPLPVAIVALRVLARRRWLHADMPRAAATAPAS